jgi:predicted transcriptional regulator
MKPKTARLEDEQWRRVEQLAAADRRPAASWLRLLIEDALAGRLRRCPPGADAKHVEAA